MTAEFKTISVLKPYEASSPDALTALADEEVEVTERVSLWNDQPDWVWIWCVDARGKESWTPKSYLELLDNGKARLLRDYDAHELTVHLGERLTGTLLTAGWLWCRNSSGKQGWVPLENLKLEA